MLIRATCKIISLILLTIIATASSGNTDSTKPKQTTTGGLLSTHTSSTKPDTTSFFVLEIRHRVFGSFQQFDTVRMFKKFPIGDGDDIGEVVFFNPHLSITTKGEFLKTSDTLYNPAVLIRVTQGDSVKQESWAFYVSEAPHFRRNDILGFRLVDFHVDSKFVRPPMRKEPALTTDSAGRKSK